MRVTLVIMLSLLGLLELGAIMFSLSAPSDEEIRESFVDSWTAPAIFTSFALIALMLFALVSLIAWFASPKVRGLSVAVFAVTIAVGFHWIINHIHLSERATAIWGIQLSRFYGLP